MLVENLASLSISQLIAELAKICIWRENDPQELEALSSQESTDTVLQLHGATSKLFKAIAAA